VISRKPLDVTGNLYTCKYILTITPTQHTEFKLVKINKRRDRCDAGLNVK
jgi:hypothetical protein